MSITFAINEISRYKACFVAAGVCVAVLITCGYSGRPPRVNVPEIDAQAASSKAMAKYDTNGDGNTIPARYNIETTLGTIVVSRVELPPMNLNY